MQNPAGSLFLLVPCERKPAKTENVRTDARDNAAAGQRGPIADGSMKRKPHVDGYLMDEKPNERDPFWFLMTDGPAEASLGAPPAGAGGATSVPGSALSAEELEQLTADIVAALKTVYDPEIPADIYELGLIYKIDIDDDRNVAIEMTLTAPGCPVAGEMPQWVENAVASVTGVGQVKVTLTFDPPWDKDRMSDEAKLALNMF
jgi:FeS assembly SUF system protein